MVLIDISAVRSRNVLHCVSVSLHNWCFDPACAKCYITVSNLYTAPIVRSYSDFHVIQDLLCYIDCLSLILESSDRKMVGLGQEMFISLYSFLYFMWLCFWKDTNTSVRSLSFHDFSVVFSPRLWAHSSTSGLPFQCLVLFSFSTPRRNVLMITMVTFITNFLRKEIAWYSLLFKLLGPCPKRGSPNAVSQLEPLFCEKIGRW